MYRSFVTCDDPKGVIECGTIRKSKNASQKMENKMRSSEKAQKNSKTSMAYKEKREEMAPKGVVEEYNHHHSPSSFQLLEVSRGAQKLNHLIDSWSKGIGYDVQSKDIAKELLKGALDLQDSLTMLGKLQEASQYMAQLRKKQEKVESRRVDEVWSERTNFYRSQDQDHRIGFQKPRVSADGYSKDCIDELRNAIIDGLARQNLLANGSVKQKKSADVKKMESISHLPSSSSSSSQFSAAQSNDFHSADSSSMSHKDLQNKEKAPNLIAKLMGLEDIPSKMSKQLQAEKNSNHRRPVFDIDLPNIRKPLPIMQKVNYERRTLKELMETGQFQGLLKESSAAKEFKYHSHHQYRDFHSEQRLIDDITPIVLIKPLRGPRLVSEEVFVPTVQEQQALNTKMMLRKMKLKEEFAHRSMNHKERTLNTKKMYCRTEADEPLVERVIREEGAKDRIETIVVPEVIEVRTTEQKGAVDAKKVYRKLEEVEKVKARRFNHEQSAKDLKGEVVRTEEKEVKKSLKDSSKMNCSNSAIQQQQKKEVTDKKVDKIQKVVGSSRKLVESENLKIKNVSRNQDKTKMNSSKMRKSENGSIGTNDHISQQGAATRKPISKHSTQSATRNSKVRKQKEKQASEQTEVKSIIDNSECKEEENRIDISSNNLSVADQVSTNGEANASNFKTEEYCDDSQSSSICFATVLKPENNKNFDSFKEEDDQITDITTDDRSFKTRNQLRDLLLNSPSFLNPAEELFNLNVSYFDETLRSSSICDSRVINIKLNLDYANEFIQRRSLPDSQTTNPLLSVTRNSRIAVSLDQLVEEVCNGEETLKNYHKFLYENLLSDSIYPTLEKDMMSKGIVSSVWDLGWRNGFCVEQVEQAINDLEKLLVSDLIAEIFS